jgi:hypothetical protein
MYSTTGYPNEQAYVEDLRTNLEPLLYIKGVDLAFWADIHHFERSCPVIEGKCQGTYERPDGIVHFVAGKC